MELDSTQQGPNMYRGCSIFYSTTLVTVTGLVTIIETSSYQLIMKLFRLVERMMQGYAVEPWSPRYP